MVRSVITFACLAALTAPASAGEAASKKQALPGVDESTYSIVKPLPEPENLETTGPGQLKIGDTEVTISGDITIDIGIGHIKPRR